MTEDLDPIENAIGWLKYIADHGCVSSHDVEYLKTKVVPEALALYMSMKANRKEKQELKYETT